MSKHGENSSNGVNFLKALFKLARNYKNAIPRTGTHKNNGELGLSYAGEGQWELIIAT